MTLRLRTLSTDHEMFEFAQRYQAVSGNCITPEELTRRTYVDAFFDSNGKMCAGFTTNSEQPLIYLSDLPEEMSHHALYDSVSDIVEGGSIWVDSALTDFERGYVFIRASWRAFTMKKSYFMGGARNPKVAKRQKFIFRKVLFEGKTDRFEYLCILYCGRKYILVQIGLFILRYWISQPINNWLSSLRNATTALISRL